jgi:NADH:ubiquinone oxidoreductase subunit 6 (subunit J)
LSNPKSLLKSLIGVVAIGVIYFISWAVAGNEVTPVYTKFGITSTSSQVIGGVLITTYFLLGAGIVMVLLSMLSRIFK